MEEYMEKQEVVVKETVEKDVEEMEKTADGGEIVDLLSKGKTDEADIVLSSNLVVLEGIEDFVGKRYISSMNKTESIMEHYRKCMEQKQELLIAFRNANRNGDIWFNTGDVTIVLPNEEIRGRKYDPRYSARMLRETYRVIVTKVDDETKTVYVSHREAKQDTKHKAERAIDDCLKNGKYPMAPAKVIIAYPNLLILDIGGLGVPGFMSIRDWSPAFEFDLREHVKAGDVIKVAIYEKTQAEGTVKQRLSWAVTGVYRCSRKLIVEDPWDKIDDMFQVKNVIEVKCTHKTDGYFNGTLPGVDDLRVYGRIRKDRSDLRWDDIEVGSRYQCYIDKIDKERRGLRVVAFKRLSEDIAERI